ncbi:hypothetical protein [Actinokineospora inagensis]|uniref:hypothetical protein n=1 Tax=Actinokineospora inagensis TaxID=103730 RepID=UPI00042331BF|nr:hypothetical protein [Actinokineospora inagensis]
MTSTLDATNTIAWASLDEAISALRTHVARHPALPLANVSVRAGGSGHGRVEVCMPSTDQPTSCAALLVWLDTLTSASLILHHCDDNPQAHAYAELADGTPIMAIAPLDPTLLHGITGDRSGDRVLHWLRWQATETY